MIFKRSTGKMIRPVFASSSKSYTHRALICAALSDKPSKVACGPLCDDVKATLGCLTALGAQVGYATGEISVTPIDTSHIPKEAELNCGESASTLRFLLPVVTALGTECVFRLTDRMKERITVDKAFCLDDDNAEWYFDGNGDLHTKGKLSVCDRRIDTDASSQMFSGFLLALPLLKGAKITPFGSNSSSSYISVTRRIMADYGVKVTVDDEGGVTSEGDYISKNVYVIEGDWSSCSFWLAAGVMGKAPITVRGLNVDSLQADRKMLEILERFGADISVYSRRIIASPSKTKGIKVDTSDCPDLVPVISVLGSVSEGITEISGVSRLAYKESNRIDTVCEMINSLGGKADYRDGKIIITGTGLAGGFVDTHHDHRIAMAAAVASYKADGAVTISDDSCVKKSYPDFWDDFALQGGTVYVKGK